MTDQQETVLINADACDIREVLWQVQSLAEWNPAFLSITGSPTARIGEPHQIRVHGGLSGQLQYDLINLDRTEMSMQVPGLRETNHWQLQPAAGHGTMVTHGFTQTGPLAFLLRGANRGVAGLRLGRLKTRVEARANLRTRH